ncbi:MAG: dephospho-CoA kinase [Demequinaceae bacterium]|nr:dephospho-CoA kinase [Demequinaceae bacterium]
MSRVGLTGGIASGKSVATRHFAKLGAYVIDHDDLAREAVKPGSAALADIAREFGDALVVDGELDRTALADIVFSDVESLERLNAITHPYIYSLAIAAERTAREEGHHVILHSVPLLVETDQGNQFDIVVTVAAPKALRIRRMIQERGMTRQQAEARIASQATDEERAVQADVVLDGSGTVESLNMQVDRFWREHLPVSQGSTSVKK